jgi:hypothetical protein
VGVSNAATEDVSNVAAEDVSKAAADDASKAATVDVSNVADSVFGGGAVVVVSSAGPSVLVVRVVMRNESMGLAVVAGLG